MINLDDVDWMNTPADDEIVISSERDEYDESLEDDYED